eukprot:749178-Amphidinium_carterae.2
MDSLTATINPLIHDQHFSSIQSKPQQDNQRKHGSNLYFAWDKETSREQLLKLPFQDIPPLSKCRTDMLASSPLQGVASNRFHGHHGLARTMVGSFNTPKEPQVFRPE